MLHVLETSKLTPVLTSAQSVLDLIDNGVLMSDAEPHKAQATIATDRLQRALHGAAFELSESVSRTSPFLRYRDVVLQEYDTALKLRALVLHLWNDGWPVRLGNLMANADARHKRIAFELIASYAEHGENDPHFMHLAEEIRDLVRDRAEQLAA